LSGIQVVEIAHQQAVISARATMRLNVSIATENVMKESG